MSMTNKATGLIVGAVIFAALSGIMIRLFLTESVAAMDQAAFQLVSSLRSEMLTSFFSGITNLGGGAVLAPLGVVLVIWMYVKGHRAEAAAIALTLVAGDLLNELLKAVFARPRPEGFHLIELPDSFSYPSGHAMVSPAFYGMLAYIISGWLREKRGSLYIQPVVFLFVTLIAVSRVYLGVHYLSDVLTGFCLSMVFYFLTRAGYDRWMEGRRDIVRPLVHPR